MKRLIGFSVVAFYLVLLGGLLSPAAQQQEEKVFKIVGDLVYKQNGFKPSKIVKLTAQDAPADSVLIWNVEGNQSDYVEDGNTITIAMPVGSHRVTLRAVSVENGKAVLKAARPVTVTVEATRGCSCRENTGECNCGKK